MNPFKTLFNLVVHGNGASEKILDGGIAAADKLFYTGEEKADDRRQLVETWKEVTLALADKGTGTAVNRRILTWFVVFNWTIVLWVGVGVMVVQQDMTITNLIGWADSLYVGFAFMSAVVFYFGPHLLGVLKK